jgi:hypothetical protein
MKRFLSLFLVLVFITTGSFMGCTKSKKNSDTADVTSDNYVNKDKPSEDGSEPEQSFHAKPEAADSYEIPESTTGNGISESTADYDAAYDDTAGTYEEAMPDSSNALSKDAQDYSQYRYWNYYDPYEYNTEEFTRITEAGYQDTYSQPLSTFSIDVDTASYTNLRKDLNNGIIPEADAIRIEEMLNYFHYDYEEPDGKVPFTINLGIISDFDF